MPAAGDIKGGDVEVIGPGLIRLDLTPFDSSAYADGNRLSAVLDLNTARALTIALIESIKQAEVEEVRTNKRKKK